ncbi:hypothetical protein BGX27_002661 [Mortierella sp. AM989]|nr:hypothetical protein BGX27_002661 [Mortierella sp. AM989]
MTDINTQQETIEAPTLVKSSQISKFKPLTSLDSPKVHGLPVLDVFKNHLNSAEFGKGDGNAFFVADLGEIYRQHVRWMTNLPRIEPFYAVKCNSDPMVLRLLTSLGAGFDCGTKYEIEAVLKAGVDPSNIVYAHPCKQNSFLNYARDVDVSMMTFDNIEELYKIKKLYPQAQCIIRILVDDTNSHGRLGLKFGAPMDKVNGLLLKARELELNVIGVSFHVGSYCVDAVAFRDALVRARYVFTQAKVEYGYDFKLLDIGGGFLSDSETTVAIRSNFEEVAEVVTRAVDLLFESDIRVIAEPGRYYVNSAFTLAAQVIGRRSLVVKPPSSPNHFIRTPPLSPVSDSSPDSGSSSDSSPGADAQYMYYLNDGIFGSFAAIKYFPRDCSPKALRSGGKFVYHQQKPRQQQKYQGELPYNGTHTKAIVWGPTLANPDCITMEATMPVLQNGDWVYYEDVGAYSIAVATEFHGIPPNDVLYTATEPAVFDYLL